MKILINELWNIVGKFSFGFHQTKKNESWRGKWERKKLQNNICKMKKACRRYVSITCNEIFIIGWCWKTCICLFEWRKQIFINLICEGRIQILLVKSVASENGRDGFVRHLRSCATPKTFLIIKIFN
jgi:hypothetical protein